MRRKHQISIERLHLIAGFSLVFSGLLVYFLEGIEAAISWGVFGAMYISMSDVGENEMSAEKRNHLKHKTRRFFGYVGAGFSIVLLCYYFNKLILYSL